MGEANVGKAIDEVAVNRTIETMTGLAFSRSPEAAAELARQAYCRLEPQDRERLVTKLQAGGGTLAQQLGMAPAWEVIADGYGKPLALQYEATSAGDTDRRPVVVSTTCDSPTKK